MSLDTSNVDLGDDSPGKMLHGLLVGYKDDQLNDCVNSALRSKSRVRYKCMDTHSNFLAFGTTGGAIYLFRLKSITHSSCTLASMIPCDQGSIEVIKFLHNPQSEELLVAIGTSRGSLVVFRLTQLPGQEQSRLCNEIYRAEYFTNNHGIKMIECDLDLFDPSLSFTKLYICDTANQLYVLDSSSIYQTKQTLRLFYSNNLPSLIFSVNDSTINQISVHRSQLLISTDETTRVFNEYSNQIYMIGKKKRREGFYGASFFNPTYKPARLMQSTLGSQQTIYSSTGSLSDRENLLIFVARPMFRLWQVNNRREVMFTHQFEPSIKSTPFSKIIDLSNEPLSENECDDPSSIIDSFEKTACHQEPYPKSDHFRHLMPIYSPTLGNLLLSYTQHELFIVDPIGAKLVVSYSQEASIVQVCCNENEIFIWSLAIEDGGQRHFQVNRLVLLAPTQFVLELHRIHCHLSLITFVQIFYQQFRQTMALPLSGKDMITTEGGLLRNVLLNAWDILESQIKANNEDVEEMETRFQEVGQIIDDIVYESKQLRESMNNVSDSRFFLTMTMENIERLCSEPYASLVSLDISLANLHTNHVIHFNKEALNRHKSVANLSHSIKNLNILKQTTKSNCDLRTQLRYVDENSADIKKNCFKLAAKQTIEESKVIVERQRPARSQKRSDQDDANDANSERDLLRDSKPFFSVKERDEYSKNQNETDVVDDKGGYGDMPSFEQDTETRLKYHVDQLRCPECKWPRRRSHLKRMHSSQQIQYNWIQTNLLPNFEENIDQIEESALKNALWDLFLRCLAFKNKLDDYIICCIMLDDVRLLNVEQFVITRRGEDEIIDCLLEHLNRKVDFQDQNKNNRDSDNQTILEYCYKCKSKLDSVLGDGTMDDELDEFSSKLGDDDISFNLVNLFEQFMMRRNADLRKAVARLLEHQKLLNSSKIPASFYLKAIANAATVANQSSFSKARLRLNNNVLLV